MTPKGVVDRAGFLRPILGRRGGSISTPDALRDPGRMAVTDFAVRIVGLMFIRILREKRTLDRRSDPRLSTFPLIIRNRWHLRRSFHHLFHGIN